jgi:hypothetical protein
MIRYIGNVVHFLFLKCELNRKSSIDSFFKTQDLNNKNNMSQNSKQSRKRNMEENEEENSIKYVKANIIIPDISYLLVFCFLRLKDLCRIVQCSKKMKQMVISSTFISMYHNNKERIKFNDVKFGQAIILNPLCKLIQNTTIPKYCPLFVITLLPLNFPRLHTLSLEIDWRKQENQNDNIDFISVFQFLSPGLRQLSVEVVSFLSFPTPPSVRQFQTALSCFTCLKRLNLKEWWSHSFDDVSFIKHMQQLETFECNFSVVRDIDNIIDHIRALPSLTKLNLPRLYEYSLIDESAANKQLENLCVHSKHLKHLGSIHGNGIDGQQHCARLLSLLPCLETIDLSLSSESYQDNPVFPKAMQKLIKTLYICRRIINQDDILTIKSLPKITSLNLNCCEIDCLNLQTILCGLACQLEILEINALYIVGTLHYCELSFLSISKCTKLKSLKLSNIIGLVQSEIPLMLNCKQLTCIQLNMRLYPPEFKEELNNTFSIPSTAFPKLKYAHFLFV